MNIKLLAKNVLILFFLGREVFSRVNSLTVIAFRDYFPMKKFYKFRLSYCFYLTATPFIRMNSSFQTL